MTNVLAAANLEQIEQRLRASVAAQDHAGAMLLVDEYRAAFETALAGMNSSDAGTRALVVHARTLLRWCLKSAVAMRAGLAARRSTLTEPRAVYGTFARTQSSRSIGA